MALMLVEGYPNYTRAESIMDALPISRFDLNPEFS